MNTLPELYLYDDSDCDSFAYRFLVRSFSAGVVTVYHRPITSKRWILKCYIVLHRVCGWSEKTILRYIMWTAPTKLNQYLCCVSYMYNRCADDDDSRRLPMLLDAVLSSDVHGSTTSQVSLLHHEPRPSLLRLLSHLHSHLHSAASLRRTRRHRFEA